MSITDGVNANAANFNSSYVSKTDADAKGGDLTLNDKLSLQDSGSATMADAQQEINDLKDEFNSSTGHDHDGVDSKKVVASNLDGTGGSNGQVLKADGAGNVLWDTDEGTGAINYIGAWNANTNSPALASGAGTKGDYYVVNVAGTTTLDGISDWENTDWAVFNGTAWEKVDNTDQVLSVAGKQGAVVLDSDDVTETASKKWAFKSNLTTSDPTTTDDSASGYSVGSRWWNSSSDTLFICEDNTASAAVWKGVSGGAGSGGLDVYLAEDFETTVAADFTSGNNATFDNGGTLQGTLADETTNPIAGSSCLKYTQAAGSLNDFIKSPVINIDEKQAGNYTGMTLYFTYDGDADDIKVIFYDETNSEVLTDSVDLLSSESNPTRYSTSVFIPEGVTQVAYGFQVAVENSTKILLADDVELTTNPFVYKNLIDRQYVEQSFDPASMTTTSGDLRFGSVTLNGSDILSYDDSNGRFAANRECTFTGMFSGRSSSTNTDYIIKLNGTTVARTDESGADFYETVSTTLNLQVGDYVNVNASNTLTSGASQYLSISAEAETEHVITPAKSNMTDWTSYTPSTSQGFGTLGAIDLKWKREGSDMLIQGTFVSGTSTATEARLELPTGHTTRSDLPTRTVAGKGAYTGTGAVDQLVLIEPSRTYMNFGIAGAGTAGISAANGSQMVAAGQTYGLLARFPIEGWDSNATFLAAIPTQLTAYIKDVKSANTVGGTSTTGTWSTRDLNTVSGDASIVSLSSNQFTLSAGTYTIKASAPALFSSQHRIKLYNVTDVSDDILGSSEFSNTSFSMQSISLLSGKITLTSSKVFEIRHRVASGWASSGFGAPSVMGVDEVYTQVEITKVK